MEIYQIHPSHFEKWDFRNLDIGIGGSETCQVEMSWRLAQRGHKVVNYAPIKDDTPNTWRSTLWEDLTNDVYKARGLYVLYRCPEELDRFGPPFSEHQRLWLLCQDADYRDRLTEERAAKLEKVIVLCPVHARHLQKEYPFLKEKIVIGSNGLRVDLIEEVETEQKTLRQEVLRDKYRCIYTSSPDRGLVAAIKIVQRAREYNPHITLHAFYGLDNIEKHVSRVPRSKKFVQELRKLLQLPGIHWHGRTSQRNLYKEILKSNIWLYPSHFGETSAISCMEHQALGAIPITNPYWALADNVDYGFLIPGDPRTCALTRAKYVSTLLDVIEVSDRLKDYRQTMMQHARQRFDWERQVDQWERWIGGET